MSRRSKPLAILYPPNFFCSRVSRLAEQVVLAGVFRQYSYTVQQKREWKLVVMGLRDPWASARVHSKIEEQE
jgi:hypothetical protein